MEFIYKTPRSLIRLRVVDIRWSISSRTVSICDSFARVLPVPPVDGIRESSEVHVCFSRIRYCSSTSRAFRRSKYSRPSRGSCGFWRVYSCKRDSCSRGDAHVSTGLIISARIGVVDMALATDALELDLIVLLDSCPSFISFKSNWVKNKYL